MFNGFTLTSYSECPLYIASGDKVTVSAKKNTENYIYDMRSEVTDEDEVSSAVYALCDLNVQGKGTLSVKSANNNGIHTKDDLKAKNLTLNVTCKDNALKGNDSVTIESGVITLIATEGDGIKTTNSDVSSKGNQRGIVFSGGRAVIISYGQADSAIDTENGYAYTGGYILAIGISGGMSGETVNANNFNSVGKSENITLKAGVYLSAGDYITVRMPQAMNARAVFLGDSGVSFGTSNSSSLTFDDNGVCFNK